MPKNVRSNWSDVVLVCRKCSKKLRGGFGPDRDRALAKVLKRQVAATAPQDGGKHKGRHARLGVVAVGCLGVCPKDAVTVIRAGQPQVWRIVPAGTDVRDVLEMMGWKR